MMNGPGANLPIQHAQRPEDMCTRESCLNRKPGMSICRAPGTILIKCLGKHPKVHVVVRKKESTHHMSVSCTTRWLGEGVLPSQVSGKTGAPILPHLSHIFPIALAQPNLFDPIPYATIEWSQYIIAVHARLNCNDGGTFTFDGAL
eukprot:1149578-Pelagomonas_calceolata.AAC.6